MKVFWASVAFFVGSIFTSSMSMGAVTSLHDRFGGQPLSDLGHMALPDLWVGQYTLLTFLIACWVVGCAITVLRHKCAYSIYTRALVNLGVLLMMRSFSILVTIQPSPYGDLPPPPTSPWYYALDYRNLFTSVGDNMFSAHTCFLTIPYLVISSFVVTMWSMKHLMISLVYGFLVFWIIASHLHYTADVVIALYLSYSTWLALSYYIPCTIGITPHKENLYDTQNKLYV